MLLYKNCVRPTLLFSCLIIALGAFPQTTQCQQPGSMVEPTHSNKNVAYIDHTPNISEVERLSLIFAPFYILDSVIPEKLLANNVPPLETISTGEDPAPQIDYTNDDSWWTRQPKEKKLLYTNIFAATVVGLYGLSEWNYGETGFQTADEGWFDHDTIHGGADKLGHFWATYTFADALTGLYNHWGYETKKANRYAAWSAWGVQAFMELADATSEDHGFSWEDLVMNSLGALTSVFMANNPSLDDKIDFRLEYVFNEEVNNFFDDYSNHYYSVVLKLDGFESIESNLLQYLEFHAGYYTRGYDKAEKDNVRSLYAGISFNFSKFFYKHGWNKTGKTVEYLQVPYTVLKTTQDLD